ncbi:hypothetical protein ZHAS_00016675 [Anopheles sinensis]|uniref:G_PROTEIN_RECEP_F3_4 domain-containing protein n=1 Tax=Anopheles sinensis TaxID=74873 RepID=A0A084WEN4_ANOSI|nr:hypothetical protein ZHAS_00016675 [Anopheles sinensis]
MVRKAPSEFNESRFISMAIYNEFLLTCFLNVSMLFLQSPANPDLLYIIFFCHTQLTVTLLLGLIFGSKVYLVFRGGGKHQDHLVLNLLAARMDEHLPTPAASRRLPPSSEATWVSTEQLHMHRNSVGRADSFVKSKNGKLVHVYKSSADVSVLDAHSRPRHSVPEMFEQVIKNQQLELG